MQIFIFMYDVFLLLFFVFLIFNAAGHFVVLLTIMLEKYFLYY